LRHRSDGIGARQGANRSQVEQPGEDLQRHMAPILVVFCARNCEAPHWIIVSAPLPHSSADRGTNGDADRGNEEKRQELLGGDPGGEYLGEWTHQIGNRLHSLEQQQNGE
jgi:hypothetical protein